MRDATVLNLPKFNKQVNFNPRIPCGMRPASSWVRNTLLIDFNPRIPCGMRQPSCWVNHAYWSISIHASHAGCDSHTIRIISNPITFQSTHPMRDATIIGGTELIRSNNFNPRIPCGMRHVSKLPLLLREYFNPRIPCGMRRTRATTIWYGNDYFNPRFPCGMRPSMALHISR